MSFISYAQNFEDVILWRALKSVEKGFYIDVGANDPNQDSVTKAFYELGWRGINIEPIPQMFEKLESERPRDINLQIAAGAEQGELLLYELPDTGLSTSDKTIAERHEAKLGLKKIIRTVPVNSLTNVCKDYHTAPIHFLKIDVEGAEKQTLEGLDFSKIRPWIILIESTLPNTQIEDYEDWDPILLAGDYEFVYFDGLNRFYVAKEHKEIKNSFKVPPNCFDGFVLSETQPFCSYVATQAKQAQAALAEQQAYAQRLEGERNAALAEQQAHAQRLEGERNAAKAKIAELNHSSHHWWTVADGLNKELQAVYRSSLWRITWPLRKLMQLSKRLFRLSLRLVFWLAGLPKRMVRKVFVKAVAFALRRSRLKAWKSSSVDLLGMTPRARRIYSKLKAAHGKTSKAPH